ncbi:MAG: RHS repeat-associated core domain-containing protein [Actinomycetota bacterium]|nr:RHS repeat-associated core domain-containing protein [Actinomycetota bacterium]
MARYAYDPYGGLVGMSGDPIATRNPLRYRGYYYDNETQLYYLPARYYNPDTARFLSVDPAPPSAGDPTSLNGYAYCVGDPVQFDDPTGAYADERGAVGSDSVLDLARILKDKDDDLTSEEAVAAAGEMLGNEDVRLNRTSIPSGQPSPHVDDPRYSPLSPSMNSYMNVTPDKVGSLMVDVSCRRVTPAGCYCHETGSLSWYAIEFDIPHSPTGFHMVVTGWSGYPNDRKTILFEGDVDSVSHDGETILVPTGNRVTAIFVRAQAR